MINESKYYMERFEKHRIAITKVLFLREEGGEASKKLIQISFSNPLT
jgi:hypothetical protein